MWTRDSCQQRNIYSHAKDTQAAHVCLAPHGHHRIAHSEKDDNKCEIMEEMKHCIYEMVMRIYRFSLDRPIFKWLLYIALFFQQKKKIKHHIIVYLVLFFIDFC